MFVNSEIGNLKKVLLYRPGQELENLLPAYMQDMLFDEIPWLKRAREEHDAFAQALTQAGTRVYYIQDLVGDIMANPELKKELILQHLHLSNLTDQDTLNAVCEYLMALPANDAAELLTAGLHKRLVRDLKDHLSLSDLTPVGFPFYLPPLPSMYFVRDHGIMVGTQILMSSMYNPARMREPLFLRKLIKHHPLFAEVDILDTEPMPKGLEGGDVLVLREDTLLVGLSQRTTEQAIETLAQRLMVEQQKLKQILVLQIPFDRAYMHLDTVFTMLDHDKFLFYPGIKDSVYLYRLTLGARGRVKAEQLGDLQSGLSQALNRPIQIIYSNGSSLHQAAREQWNDSTNTLAVAPGKVVVYNRNTLSNRSLRKAGIEIIEIEGSELVRGRGGPRCMSLPLEREKI